MRAADMAMLPWTIRGPRRVTDAKGTRFEMRVVELPDFVIGGGSESEVLYGFNKALLAYLESLISAGQIPKLPAGKPVRYSTPSRGRDQVSLVRGQGHTGTPMAPFTLTLQS